VFRSSREIFHFQYETFRSRSFLSVDSIVSGRVSQFVENLFSFWCKWKIKNGQKWKVQSMIILAASGHRLIEWCSLSAIRSKVSSCGNISSGNRDFCDFERHENLPCELRKFLVKIVSHTFSMSVSGRERSHFDSTWISHELDARIKIIRLNYPQSKIPFLRQQKNFHRQLH
jgi:hypothetical protein